MANPYHDFSIDKRPSGYESLNQGIQGLGNAFSESLRKRKEQEDAIKLFILQEQFKQQNALAQEQAKQQTEFDMQQRQFDRAMQWRQQHPDMFGMDPARQQELDMMQGNEMAQIEARKNAAIATKTASGQFNPVKKEISPFVMKVDPMTGKMDQVENPAYKLNEKDPTAAQETTALYAGRLKQANDIFDNLESYISNLPVVGTKMNELAPNWLKSSEYQSYVQAQKNFLNAVLRRESGAVISPSEFKEGREQYFPQPGDKPEVIAQKKQNRRLVMENFIQSSRRAYVPFDGMGSSMNSNDPLGIRS